MSVIATVSIPTHKIAIMHLIYTIIVDRNDRNVSVVRQFAINLASEIRQRNLVTAYGGHTVKTGPRDCVPLIRESFDTNVRHDSKKTVPGTINTRVNNAVQFT